MPKRLAPLLSLSVYYPRWLRWIYLAAVALCLMPLWLFDIPLLYQVLMSLFTVAVTAYEYHKVFVQTASILQQIQLDESGYWQLTLANQPDELSAELMPYSLLLTQHAWLVFKSAEGRHYAWLSAYTQPARSWRLLQQRMYFNQK